MSDFYVFFQIILKIMAHIVTYSKARTNNSKKIE